MNNKFQFLMVKEFKQFFDLKDEECVLILKKSIYPNPLEIKNASEVAAYGNWKEIYFIDFDFSKNTISLLKNDILFHKKVTRILKGYERIDNLVFGNYKNIGYRTLQVKYKNIQSYYLDEGNSTVLFYHSRLSKWNLINNINFFTLTRLLTGFVVKPPSKVNFFTNYNLQSNHNTTIIKFEYTRSLSNIEVDKGVVYFAGMPLVELNFIDKELYWQLMINVKKHFPNHEIFYLPHRSEYIFSENDFKEIGINLLKNEIPFELFLMQQNKVPEIIASFWSTVLNSYNIFKDHANYNAFYINPKILKNHIEIDIQKHYDYYKDNFDEKYFKIVYDY